MDMLLQGKFKDTHGGPPLHSPSFPFSSPLLTSHLPLPSPSPPFHLPTPSPSLRSRSPLLQPEEALVSPNEVWGGTPAEIAILVHFRIKI